MRVKLTVRTRKFPIWRELFSQLAVSRVKTLLRQVLHLLPHAS